MKKLFSASLLVSAFGILTACTEQTPPPSWSDALYQEKMQTGNNIFQAHHTEQAISFYQEAYKRAFLADNIQAIHDAGFNLALAYQAERKDKDALKIISQTQNALEERHYQGLKAGGKEDLTLLKANFLYKAKNWENAHKAALEAEKSPEKSVFIQALYLQALCAFEENHLSELNDILQKMRKLNGMTVKEKVNMLELQTDQDLLSQNWEEAVKNADLLSNERRGENDYYAMRRALSKKATALTAMGHSQEAGLIQKQLQESKNQQAE